MSGDRVDLCLLRLDWKVLSQFDSFLNWGLESLYFSHGGEAQMG